MSLKPGPIQPVPEDTLRVAQAAFPKGNLYLVLRDKLGPIFDDEDFVGLFPKDGQPGLPPWRLALVTILQFRENLSDRQAAEAVRARIDWKYLLGYLALLASAKRLTRHLDQVEVLLSQWLGELSDPGLFYRRWNSLPKTYTSPLTKPC